MHKLTPKIEKVIAFIKWLSDKQISAKRAVRNLGYITIFGPLEQMSPQLQKSMQICTLVDHDISNNFSFGSGD
jgi:hypothetical protein